MDPMVWLNGARPHSPHHSKVPYFIEYSCVLLSKENYDELLPAHYTWKEPEKGFKIKWVMH